MSSGAGVGKPLVRVNAAAAVGSGVHRSGCSFRGAIDEKTGCVMGNRRGRVLARPLIIRRSAGRPDERNSTGVHPRPTARQLPTVQCLCC
jgi:hypothetical protein